MCDTVGVGVGAPNRVSRSSHGPLVLTAQPGHFCGLVKAYHSAALPFSTQWQRRAQLPLRVGQTLRT